MNSRILGAAAGLLVASAAGHAGEIYTDEQSFVEDIGYGYSLNDFDDVNFGPQPPLVYDTGDGFLYVISSPGGLFCDTGEVSTEAAGDPIIIDITDCPLTAVGGHFWVRDAGFNVIPGQITLTYSDGTKDVFASGAKETFRGYRSDGEAIVQVRVLAEADGGVEGWPVMSDMYLAYPCHADCYQDCDNDGDMDLFDWFCFINEFNEGRTYADCDGDGSHDLFDFLCYQNQFWNDC